jgi:hypothetical protein
MPISHPKAKIRDGFRVNRSGYNAKPALTARLQQAGLPNLLDPNLKAAAFHQNGQWVVIPGPASGMYGQRYLKVTGSTSSIASTPDSVASSITGDIDIRVKVSLVDWTPSTGENDIIGKWAVGQRTYFLSVTQTGLLKLYFSSDGAVLQSAVSTASVSVVDGNIKWIRATLDVDNGANGRDAAFYTSDDGVTWTQLGTTVTQGGTISIFDSTAPVSVGGWAATTAPAVGNIFYAEIRNGINGPVVVKFDPTNDTVDGTTSFTSSSTGEVWTVSSAATIRSGVPVTNSGANGFESTPFWPDANGPMMAAKDITDATAPFVAASDAQALLGSTFWSSDHTVLAVTMPTTLTNANPVIWSHGATNFDGAAVYTNSTAVRAVHSGGATSQDIAQAVTGGGLGKWMISWLGRSGSNYIVRANGLETVSAVTVTSDNPVAKNLYFGRNNNTNSPIRGPLACVLFYSTAHSSAKKAEIESLLTGNYAVGTTGIVPITTTRSGAVRDVGAVEPENLIARSEQPSLAPWSMNGSTTISDGGVISGVNTCKVLSTAAAAFPAAFQSFGVLNTTVGSVEVDLFAGSVDKARVLFYDNVATASVAGVTASVLSGPGTLSGSSTFTVSNLSPTVATRVRLSSSSIVSGRAHSIYVYVNAPSSVNGDYIYFARPLACSSLAGTYLKTYADARPGGPVIFTAGDNARIAHPTKGLPCFGAVTNLLLQSEDLTSASWVKNRVTTTANVSTVVAPDRSTNADKIVEDTSATTTHYLIQAITKAASALQYTYSVFVKAGERPKTLLQLTNSGATGGASAIFDLSAGTFSSVTSSGTFTGPSATITNAGNGWWRCTVTGTTDTDTVVRGETYIHNGASVTFTGDGASGIYVWGSQLEQSSFAGPYVPTTTASASASADQHVIVPPAQGFPSPDFEVELDFTPSWSTPRSTASYNLFDTRSNALTGGGCVFIGATSGNLSFQIRQSDTSAFSATITSLSWVPGQKYRIRAICQRGTIRVLRDGVSSAVQNAANGAGAHDTAQVSIGKLRYGTNEQPEGHVSLSSTSASPGNPKPTEAKPQSSFEIRKQNHVLHSRCRKESSARRSVHARPGSRWHEPWRHRFQDL